MRVLVTGSQGFIAKNLLERLRSTENIDVLVINRKDSNQTLVKRVQEADFIFHLAGVNRPKSSRDFFEGNCDLTSRIVAAAQNSKKHIPILMTSSTQIGCDNDYGRSKLEGEKILERHTRESGSVAYIYRLPNVFGKWSRPNYNTVIATWCHNISRGLPIQVSDESIELTLVYVDDVVSQFVHHLGENSKHKHGIVYGEVSPLYIKNLGEIKNLLNTFKESRVDLVTPYAGHGFERALYATYLSFLPVDKFSYTLYGHEDERGSFYEFIKTMGGGQFSISTTAPGITRGGHYHNTKNEKFLVIKGKACIRLRHVYSDDIIKYKVSDKQMEVVEMIPGYTHDITNTGNDEMVLLIWANEIFDRENPDTYFLKVQDKL